MCIRDRLEPRPVTESADRVWNYVAVGCGKDLQWWKEFFSVCHMMGYDGDVSLEMEDLTMTCLLYTSISKPLELNDEDVDKLNNWISSLHIDTDMKKELQKLIEHGSPYPCLLYTSCYR